MCYLERGADDVVGIFCDEVIQFKKSAQSSTPLSTEHIKQQKGRVCPWFKSLSQYSGSKHRSHLDSSFQHCSPVLSAFSPKQAMESGHRTSPARVHPDCFSISDLEQAQLSPHYTPVNNVTITFTDLPEFLSQNHKKKKIITTKWLRQVKFYHRCISSIALLWARQLWNRDHCPLPHHYIDFLILISIVMYPPLWESTENP